jgi:hypothetical protein
MRLGIDLSICLSSTFCRLRTESQLAGQNATPEAVYAWLYGIKHYNGLNMSTIGVNMHLLGVIVVT